MLHNITIGFNNIVLRQITENDIEMLRIWRNNPQNSLYLRKINYITPEMQKKWYDNYLKNNNEIAFAIVETKYINDIVGSVSLYDFSDKRAEFGKILIGNENAHGKKIGYMATVATLKIAFDILDLEEVVLECNNDNIPAIRVYEQVGFVFSETINNIRYYKISKQQFLSTQLKRDPKS